MNSRVHGLALAQTADIRGTLEKAGVRLVAGRGRFAESDATSATHDVHVELPNGERETVTADVVLVATGASPASCPTPSPTASASSPGASSTTWTRCPSTSSSSGPG